MIEKHPRASFQKNESVILPSHGVGKMVDIIKIENDGTEQEFYEIHFDDQKMNVFISVENAASSGLRKIASKDVVNKVLDILSKPPRGNRWTWNKKMKEYDAKIFSGSILLTAEVVRDGYICTSDPNKSYTERSRYKIALERVINEISHVLKASKDETETKILDILNATQGKKAEEADDFDLEFEDFSDEEDESDEKDSEKIANDKD